MFNRKTLLLFGFFQFVFPFLDAGSRAAEFQELLFVVNQFFAADADVRPIMLEENRLFRANFLTEAAINAAEHVDLELQRHLLGVWTIGLQTAVAGRRDADGFRRTDKFAELTRDAFGVAVLVLHEIRRATI